MSTLKSAMVSNDLNGYGLYDLQELNYQEVAHLTIFSIF